MQSGALPLKLLLRKEDRGNVDLTLHTLASTLLTASERFAPSLAVNTGLAVCVWSLAVDSVEARDPVTGCAFA